MPLSIRILIGLLLGIAIGAALSFLHFGQLSAILATAGVVGTLWLNALKMTIVPLIFTLVVSSINSVSKTISAGRLATQTLIMISILLISGAILSAVVSPLLLAIWPVTTDASHGLLSAVGASHRAILPAQPVADMITAIIPPNALAAASQGDMVPFVFFTLVFGFALATLSETPRAELTKVLGAVAQTMVVIINWILLVAPLGVFALGIRLGASGSANAAGALGHYIAVTVIIGLISILSLYPLVKLRGIPIRFFAARIAPAQMVAVSTSSSLASLPAMIESAADLGIPSPTAGLVLPLAVTTFRYTSPAMNVAAGLWIASLYGLHPTPSQIVATGAVSLVGSVAAVGLPGAINLFITYVPICVVLGLPVDVLPLLLAVDAIPDIIKTVGNVTADLTLATLMPEAPAFRSG